MTSDVPPLQLRPSGNLLEDAGTWGEHPQSLQTAS